MKNISQNSADALTKFDFGIESLIRLKAEKAEIIYNDFDLSNDVEMHLFCATKTELAQFGISSDAILLVGFGEEISPNAPCLAWHRTSLEMSCGFLAFDSFIERFYIERDYDAPQMIGSKNCVGKIIGFCAFDELDSNKIAFNYLKKELTNEH